ncbi:restriction endonuclease subunit S [Prosthecochloris marina]|uniref:Restriction endonuclease subunit S n=1 Tax=Prosthecochloris marina TaxID=2017681 RepID=A0A317T6B7_9CHLB|nr:restriction endonuclease subunit S [Prosthecochloris marina]PWW81277.1 restriction endonuclease subunit S [Prosthecochloris marina]
MNKYRRVVLGDIAKISSGGTPSRSNPEYWDGNIPWVKTAQIQNRIINEESVDEWITEEGLHESSAKIISAETILMAMYGQGKTRGQIGILTFDASINQACAAIELKKGVYRDYIYQALLANYSRIRNMSNSGGQANLSATLIKEIPVMLPSFAEQKAIADLLFTWDQAIEKTERLIRAKERQLDAYARNLFDRRNDGKYDGWKVVELKMVLTEHGDKSIGIEEVYSVSVHKGLVNQVEHLGRSFSAANTDNYNRVHFGDIVYTKSPTGDFPLGIVKQSYAVKDVIVSPLYGVFTPKTFNLGIVLDFYFSSPARARNYLFPIVQKGAKNTIAITNKTFLSNTLHLPVDEQAQKEVAEFVSAARKEIDLLKKLADKYKTQKSGLMQKMLTGEWKVKPEIVNQYMEV